MVEVSFEYINPRYLLGISDEPKQLLQPISGYAREPLLPLEDACEPLKSIVPRLEVHIWIAKQNSKNPADNLTQDESAAIHLYTMEWDIGDTGDDESRGSLYAHLNRTLKQIDRTKLRPWFRYLKLLLTALTKLPLVCHQTVWRGVRKDHSADYPPGTEATWWAFSSCTTSLSVLESDLYLGTTGTRTLFSIEVLNGRAIRAHSHFQVEAEVLLLPGTFFEVKSRLNPAPDLYIIHLSQKRPPFDLLDPPFEGAELMPPTELRKDVRTNLEIDNDNYKDDHRPWYKNNKIRFSIAAIIAAIIVAVVLGAVLGTRAERKSSTAITVTTTTTTPMSLTLNGSIPDPVSMADAFYAFDNDILDLYSLRNGEVIGGLVSYVQGYVAYGKALALEQSIETKIQIQPGFKLTTNTSFTIEGFFLLKKTQSNAILVQLTPTITMNLIDGVLSLSLGSNIVIIGPSVISTDQWHHFGFVYDATQQIARIYIDGSIEVTGTSVKPSIDNNANNSSIIIGSGFQGYIDQLSIVLKAKSSAVILWDATTDGYYPLALNGSFLSDKGPNGNNATAFNTIHIYGWLYDALNFNTSGSYCQTSGFTSLGTPRKAFSIALWVRAEAQGGIFLTIANPYTCLLVLGLQNDTNRLVAYLPNATASGNGVNIIGPVMPLVWVHVAFTWSFENRAQLYTSAYFQNSAGEASTLNNARGGNNSSPMTVTLGHYSGTANCQGIEGTDYSQEFTGSLDELYIFARELPQTEIKQLTIPPSQAES